MFQPSNRKKPTYEYIRSIIAGVKRHSAGGFAPSRLSEAADDINTLIYRVLATSALDYGCGRADHTVLGLPSRFRWTLYDPCLETYAKLPTETADLVSVVNVLEYAPLKDLQWIMDEICNFADKAVYFFVSALPPEPLIPFDRLTGTAYDRPEQFWLARVGKAVSRSAISRKRKLDWRLRIEVADNKFKTYDKGPGEPILARNA